ncbi:toll/interleukin-1 receptor domain-containing protein [Azospirillum sp. TSO22-1]|uniref:toll/interleukin-1 receptor domain-containing protein n=1 Tax=Azospirillum sp. TSO22-1 TaxID=716789 RepID=UPI001304F881|nr:toll/interleukin-1 receptor domain-containing protein [Azospirillum sp. TSO22-1]
MGDAPKLNSLFVSYRRKDSAGWGGRLVEELWSVFGRRNVFYDVDGIPPGSNFRVVIEETLDKVDAALVIVGPHWLTVTNAEGRPRLMEPDDHVRLEIASALRRSIPTIPILVGDAELPRREFLPEDIQGLLDRNAVKLRDERWSDDTANLIRKLGKTPPSKRGWGVSGVIGAGVLFAGILFGKDIYEYLFPTERVTKAIHEERIEPGAALNYALNLKHAGPVDVFVEDIVPDWSGRQKSPGLPELFMSICSAEEGNACPSREQVAKSNSRRRVLQPGPVTITFFNFVANPPLGYKVSVEYPR